MYVCNDAITNKEFIIIIIIISLIKTQLLN